MYLCIAITDFCSFTGNDVVRRQIFSVDEIWSSIGTTAGAGLMFQVLVLDCD